MRFLFTALLALSVACMALPAPSLDPGRVMQSVQPITFNGTPVCTAWSLNSTEGLWATAAHCIDKERIRDLNGEPMKIVLVDTEWDVAVVQSTRGVEALRLSPTPPDVGEDVFHIHYARTSRLPAMARGYVAAVVFEIPGRPHVLAFDVESGGGASGAPISTQNGVVSILQNSTAPHGPLMVAGLPWEPLVNLLSPYVVDYQTPDVLVSTPVGT